MGENSIERTLWYEAEGRVRLSQGELRDRTEPLVILGEAGMGKSTLLEWLSFHPGFAACSARQLINRKDPRSLLKDAEVLVIDALDEVSAQKDGDAVDLVLRRLGELDYPRFVLSCRVADWRSATGVEAIREQYGTKPIELHLEPFDDEDANVFLSSRLGRATAKEIVANFNKRGLQGFLGNPQTLELVARIAGKGTLPGSRGELFERAIEVLWKEHRDAKAGKQPARDAALDAAGAAFATLILTGNAAIVRTAAANDTDGELQFAEVKRLPGGEVLGAMLDTRLFKAVRPDRFGYWHRRIGEYLGARWLAKLADTRRKRARLLSLFHSHGLVPASLRGIHAWMARDPSLAPHVIAADPMGVIEYGDADNLTAEQARSLLGALETLASANPRFRDWGSYSLRGIVQPALVEDVRRVITAPGTAFALRQLVLEALVGSSITSNLLTELRQLVLDSNAIFANRRAAGDALVVLGSDADWPSAFRILHSHEDKLSLRLAIELMDKIGYGLFEDDLIVDLVVSYSKKGSRIARVLWRLKRNLPDTRLDNILERAAEDIVALLNTLDPSDREDERWRDLVQLARHKREIGAEVRAAARPFATDRPALLAWLEWLDGLAEPKMPARQLEQEQRDKEQREQEAARHAEHRQYYACRLDKVRAGEFAEIITLAKAYLDLFYHIRADGVEAHERIARWIGPEIGKAALDGFEAFLALDPPEPTADQIAASITENSHWEAGYIIAAALAERLRNDKGFDDIPDERLLTGLFELRHTKIDTHAGIEGLEQAIEAEIEMRGLWLDAMRRFHEPQLQAKLTNVNGLYALMRDEEHKVLVDDLAVEWLSKFTELPAAIEVELIDRLLRSGRYEELKSIAARRQASADDERRRNWQAVGLIADFGPTVAELETRPIEPELLWHVRARTDANSRGHGIPLSVSQLEWVIRYLRSFWPFVGHPTGVTSGDTNPWDASEYLASMIQRLGNDSSTEAVAALKRLSSAPADGYTEIVLAVSAEQARIRVESSYSPPTLETIDAITRDVLPLSPSDLQAFMVEELAVVQGKIKSDDAESWRGFFDDKGVPVEEERCRDHLLGLLRQGSTGVKLDPETHVAADKEVDIACSAGMFRLPIEIKGQWHPELWQAADKQLDTLYTQDWRAEGRGIYLVLWFGGQVPLNKRLRSAGRGRAVPQTPDQLREVLASTSQGVKDGRIVVVVLDVARS